ncbi:AraC family transcriptional regulator, partial [Escherichia coli]
MHYQSALSILNLSVKETTACCTTLVLENIRFYNCAIICLHNAQLLIKTKDGNMVNISSNSMCYVEKNTVIDITLYVSGIGVPYDIFYIDSNILGDVCKVMEPLLLEPQKASNMRTRIFSCQMDETRTKIFNRLMNKDIPEHRQIYKITYLLSKMSDINLLVYSLSVSAETSFTEQIKMIIEKNLSKPWRLFDIANILHMSEISIRKKLEKEGNNFKNLVLDIRMHRAAKLITTTEKHINSISYDVGYMS